MKIRTSFNGTPEIIEVDFTKVPSEKMLGKPDLVFIPFKTDKRKGILDISEPAEFKDVEIATMQVKRGTHWFTSTGRVEPKLDVDKQKIVFSTSQFGDCGSRYWGKDESKTLGWHVATRGENKGNTFVPLDGETLKHLRALKDAKL